jgi:MFS family permease
MSCEQSGAAGSGQSLSKSFTVGAIVIASSYSVPQMIVGRLILGVGVGAAGVIGPL